MDRRTALGKTTFDDEEHREIWHDVTALGLIWSEESDAVIKSLPWCSKQFCEFVAHLDIQAVANKSAMAKKQSRKHWRSFCMCCPITKVPEVFFLTSNLLLQLADVFIPSKWNIDLEISLIIVITKMRNVYLTQQVYLTASCKSCDTRWFDLPVSKLINCLASID